LKMLAFGAVAASMVAYLAAQLCDVYLFHFWKRLTRGRHLWLRNNASTMVSQLVDTVAVILITHYATENGLPMQPDQSVLFQLIVTFIVAGYAFKFLVAVFDTIPIYIAVRLLKEYLRIDPMHEHNIDTEGTQTG
ncbi:MAG: queuosine precursor transporter, partial [Phycisphaeraceae bacterium]|nr:queuosine precursor transporter [Phycisphaeraceae bacterium]